MGQNKGVSWLVSFIILSILPACSIEELLKPDEPNDAQPNDVVTVSQGAMAPPKAQTKISIDVRVGFWDNEAYRSIDQYTATIDDCVSGEPISLNQDDTWLTIDSTQECVFRIQSFEVVGETWVPSPGQDWSAGSSFNMTGSKGTAANILVKSQLLSPMSQSESVSVLISILDEGLFGYASIPYCGSDLNLSTPLVGLHSDLNVYVTDGDQKATDDLRFFGAIRGCLSSYTPCLTEEKLKGGFTIYQDDLDCRFEMTEFQINDETYTVPFGVDWKDGNSFTVRGADGTEAVVKVVKQLDALIKDDQEVEVSLTLDPSE